MHKAVFGNKISTTKAFNELHQSRTFHICIEEAVKSGIVKGLEPGILPDQILRGAKAGELMDKWSKPFHRFPENKPVIVLSKYPPALVRQGSLEMLEI